jgi:hypothetical protein
MKSGTGADCHPFSISTFTKCEVNRDEKISVRIKQAFVEKYLSGLGKDVHCFTGSMKSLKDLVEPGDLVV